ATGVDDPLSGRLKLYPIPARTEIYAEGIDDVTLIEIFDVTGNKHISEICDSEHVKEIPVGHLARGVYFMRLTTPGGSVMKKFVKE
ncbi:MAG: T9SS type A sorting domain-containing protein, partial [Bacteroidales bacterium]|nr:T9SS type A sorting domain-containing protein [Bacteroidales bacterium]